MEAEKVIDTEHCAYKNAVIGIIRYFSVIAFVFHHGIHNIVTSSDFANCLQKLYYHLDLVPV